MPTIETKRLKMVPFSLEVMKAALYARDRLPALTGAQVPTDWPGNDLAEVLPLFIADMEDDPLRVAWDGVIIHKDSMTIIGDMGLKNGPDERGIADVGYSIVLAYRNQGYATEMLRGVIAWAFERQGLVAITAECIYDNIGSIRVLEKAGLCRLKSTSGALWAGQEPTLIKWMIRKEEWQ
jgi:[ribosomal protein S5]-alanine N-acetyltransferase